MIDLNTCQPGQQLIRHDGLRAEYVGLSADLLDKYRHRVMIDYGNGVKREFSYMNDGRFLAFNATDPADIAEILTLPTDTPVWKAKISPDHVEADCGFWAVHQGEA